MINDDDADRLYDTVWRGTKRPRRRAGSRGAGRGRPSSQHAYLMTWYSRDPAGWARGTPRTCRNSRRRRSRWWRRASDAPSVTGTSPVCRRPSVSPRRTRPRRPTDGRPRPATSPSDLGPCRRQRQTCRTTRSKTATGAGLCSPLNQAGDVDNRSLWVYGRHSPGNSVPEVWNEPPLSLSFGLFFFSKKSNRTNPPSPFGPCSVIPCSRIVYVSFWRCQSNSLTIWRTRLPHRFGTTIKHPVPDRVKPSFVIFWHPGTLTLSTERQSARMSKITNDGLTRSGTYRMHYSWRRSSGLTMRSNKQ